MRYALTGNEKCLVYKSKKPLYRSSRPHGRGPWLVAISANGCPLNFPTRFATWRKAMDYATGDR